MPMLALADALPDFGTRQLRPPPPQPRIVEPQPAMEPAVDIPAIVAAQVAKAEAALTERLSSIYEATLQAERDNHAAERDELRRNLGTEAVALIEQRFAAMEQHLLSLTTAAAARILGALLTEEVQKRSIAALAERIRQALRENEGVRVRVMGPQSLSEALEAALGDHPGTIEFTERPSFDLSVNIDSSIYETRLSEWSADLAGVLA